jgi:outer membrane protein OmpA-like peptidoglycan-associated protein/DNA-binding transcriptional LysR family regulator
MKGRIFGALLLLVLGLATILLLWWLWPQLMDHRQTATSDAAGDQGKIRIAMDNWVGYFPLCSPEMKSSMHRSGWHLSCEDDQADYAARMQRLKNGEIDLAVATVDSYLLNGRDVDYPATIIAVIDESKGGDAILAREERVAGLDELKGKTDIRVAFTPASPSHYLAKAAADHFNVPELHPKGSLRIETEGSEKARDKLLSGATDVAILWEPDVSRALAHDGIKKILGTEDTERLIVDILLVRRQFAAEKPEAVQQLLATYFKVLKTYRDKPDMLKKQLRDVTGLPDESIKPMLSGVHWVSFMENCEKWFGIAAPGSHAEDVLPATIDSVAATLTNAGDFQTSPIPDGNPYRLTNSTFLEKLFTAGISGFTVPGSDKGGGANSLEAPFAPLDAKGWQALKEVGTLKVDPIVFQQGTSNLSLLSKQVVDAAVERLRHYPNFRVVVKGHTGTRGDKQLNQELSQQRAEAVQRYMTITYNIDPDRLRSVGFGGSAPLERRGGESKRAYEYRLPRVELVLVREEI